jgi:hypothetical protein
MFFLLFLLFSLDEISGKLLLEPDGAVRCMECGKYFTNSNNARRHVRTLHMEVGGVFACHHCDKTFEKIRSFDDHMRLKHRVYKSSMPPQHHTLSP